MYALGDTVVYRHHVCTIVDVREGYYEGKDYLELHALFEKSLKLFVAKDEDSLADLRPTMSKDEALALIDSIAGVEAIDEAALQEGADSPTLADRRLKEEYDRRLKTCSPEDLVPIMKSVIARTKRREDAGRHITATDKRYFDLAENLLCDELSASLGIERDQVRDFMVERVRRAEAAQEQR